MKPISNQGYQQALQLIRKVSTPQGFPAAFSDFENYQRVWTRDGVVIGLAALMSQEKDLIQTFKHHLITLFENQHPVGFMPSNVDIHNKTVSYGGNVGRIDTASWALIGLAAYTLQTQDSSLLDTYKNAVEKIINVLNIWEQNAKHLIYVPQSGNWADEYLMHSFILSEQLLRLWGLTLVGQLYKQQDWLQKAKQIKQVIVSSYWKAGATAHTYTPKLTEFFTKNNLPYALMGFNPSTIYSQFDLLANSLILLFNIGTPEQHTQLAHFIQDTLTTQKLHLMPCFYPSIKESDDDMKQLKNLYTFHFRNHPHEFHNGGIWTVWNGFLVQGLRQQGHKKLAHLLTNNIHLANQKNNWEFNECLHSQNFEPIGVKFCTWSAAASIFAETSPSSIPSYYQLNL